MPIFNYTAINRSGKQIKDSLDASSIETAKNSLRATGFTILEIKEQSVANKDIELPFLGNPKSKDMAVFCRQFLSILRAGVPITAVLELLGQQTENKKLQSGLFHQGEQDEKRRDQGDDLSLHPAVRHHRRADRDDDPDHPALYGRL